MTIKCTDYIVGDFMCCRCLGGDDVGVFVFVEDGDTDNEQYICEQCAREVVDGATLGRYRIEAAKDDVQ